MAGNSPGLRALTIGERGVSYGYGLVPAAFVMVVILVIIYLFTRPDMNIFVYLFKATFNLSMDIHATFPFVNFHVVLARGIFPVCYFTWGRSLGHIVVDAHVVNRKTARPMRNWQKAVRGAAQMAGGYFAILDIVSVPIALIDRERRSVYDLIAGTAVVIGDLPPETEAETSRNWVGELGRILRGRPARDPQ